MAQAPVSLTRRLVHELRRLPPWLKLFALLILTTLPGTSCTCANVEYSRAYNRVIEREVEDYVHQGALESLRLDVDTQLSGLGYVVATAASGDAIETEWRSQSAQSRDKIQVALQPSAGGHQAQITVVRQALSEQRWEPAGSQARDDLELELARALAPREAEQLDEQTVSGYSYAHEAKDIWERWESLALEQGFLMEGFEPPIDALGTSGWVEDESGKTRSRLEVRFERNKAREGELRVVVAERSARAVGQRHWEPAGEDRDRDLELGLIRLRDPSRADAIEREAERVGQQAYDDAIARGAPAGCSC